MIATKIRERLDKGKKKDPFIFIYHVLMRKYGYIPMDEYLKMPVDLVSALLIQLKEESDEQKKAMKKVKGKKGGIRRPRRR